MKSWAASASWITALWIGVPLSAMSALAQAQVPVIEQGRMTAPSAEYARVQVAFTPGENIATLIIREIRAARANIRIQAYLFTSKPLADALLAASKRGVRVEVIADANEYSDGKVSALPRLAKQGIAVLLNDRHRISHNKIILIDAEEPRATIITGSYNFTRAADRHNAENIVILSGNSALARKFLDNYNRHRDQSSRLQ
jgi:phosphatidylserine/phosphatidylglycerophosphate/cardiolipin synthase-like enzyme